MLTNHILGITPIV